MALFHRHYVWNGPSGGEFNEYRNWTPVYRDHQPPSDNDLVIFNSGGALTIDGQSGLVAEIDVVLGTTLTILNGLEATGSITGVALSADSGGTVIVGNGAEMIGIGAVDVIGFRGVGTVLVTAGGLMDDNGMVLGDRAGGTGVVTVDGPGSQLVVANNLPGQPNGVLIVGNAGTGTLAVRNGASLGSPFATLGEKVGSIGAATLDAAAWSLGLLTIGKAGSGSVDVRDGGVLTSVQVVIGRKGQLDVSATQGSVGTVTTSTLTMTGGTLDVTQGGIVAVGAATGPAGAVLVETGYNLTGLGTINGKVELHSKGELRATGAAQGLLEVTGNIIGSGTIEPLMTLKLDGAVAAGVAIVFTGPTALEHGVLILDDATAEGGTISGFAEGNTIEIPGEDFTTGLFIQGTPTNAGTLVLSGGTDAPLSLAVVGNYGPNDFRVTSDDMGTTVTLACFMPGTRIATETGPLPVERLEIGTRVCTHFSGVAPVRWIGRRAYAGRFAAANAQVWPVRICAGALADGVPQRDLLVSPKHAMLIDGVLVPAEALVNGVSVLKQRGGAVEYIHIELQAHDAVLAEGAWSETFLDDDSRGMFQNAHEYAVLYPEPNLHGKRYCAPRVEEGYALMAIWSRIAARARCNLPPAATRLRGSLDIARAGRIEGWAQDPARPEAPVCLDVLVDRHQLTRTLANRFRPDLRRAGLGSGRHAFYAVVPALRAGALVELRRSSDGTVLASRIVEPDVA